MAGEEDKNKVMPPIAAGGPRKLDRRDVLKGLSTVPALGLFGYAWQQQRQYDQATLQATARRLPRRRAGAQHRAHRRGRQGQVLTDAMLRIPGLRSRGLRRLTSTTCGVVNIPRRFKHEPNAYEDYRDARQGEGALMLRDATSTPRTRWSA